jgi:hypothetical protein
MVYDAKALLEHRCRTDFGMTPHVFHKPIGATAERGWLDTAAGEVSTAMVGQIEARQWSVK